MSPLRLLVLGLLLCRAALAGVVRVEVIERSDIVMPANADHAGPYERIIGKVHFALDPKLAANRMISDIDFAPRNSQGLVEFAADLCLFQPKDPKRGNGTVLFQVSNRGRKDLLALFNRGTNSNDQRTREEMGDGFLFDQGFTLAWIGWQYDIPAQDKLLQLHVPVARNGVQPITGLVRMDFVPEEKATQIGVADRYHAPYPVANPNDPKLTLTVRDRRDGPRAVIPRNQWRFDEKCVTIEMPAGFEPGKIYELVYEAQNPALVGLGLAAVRDFVSHLKQNRATNQIQRAIGIGSSQTGRFLRTFLYFGFNQDEQGAQVFDGVWAHIAGAGRGSFNHRFAQPSRDARPYFNFFHPTDLFPFTDSVQTDKITGLTEGLLDRVEKAGVAPRIFYTNGSYEYYGRVASLIHTTPDGTRDVMPRANTRIYFVAGSQHGPATAFPPPKKGTQYLANSNDYRWAMRGLLIAMHRWLADGREPPASTYPRLVDGSLVPLSALKFPQLPGVKFTQRIHEAFALDHGADFRTKGIVAIEPARVGPKYAELLPQVDADGNETSGLRMPWIQVPLATYTGWNPRDPMIGAPEELYSFVGATFPFAKTKAEREKTGDLRPSIAERYTDRADYLAKVGQVSRDLARAGYVLESDIALINEHAGRIWDHWSGGSPGFTAAESPTRIDRPATSESNPKQAASPGPARALPPGVRRISDVEYIKRDTGALLLDLYLPENKPSRALPVVVWIHGGGWKSGSKQGCRLAWLASDGYAVASINYRLSTVARWPAQLEDARAAIQWLRTHTADHRLDANRVAVAGESSGANLAALVGTLDVPPQERVSSRVGAVIDFFGTSDIARLAANVPGPEKTDADLAKTNGALLLGGIVRDRPELARAVSPYYHASENDPPFLIIHGDQDSQVPLDHSVRLHEQLKANRVPSEVMVLPGAGHGGAAFDSPSVKAAIRAFLRRSLTASQ